MRFLYSAVEHPAVIQAMERVSGMGHDVEVLPVTARGVLDIEAAQRLLTKDTALVLSLIHISLSDAEVVTVYRVEDGWARVRTGGGREGYCLEGLLNIL